MWINIKKAIYIRYENKFFNVNYQNYIKPLKFREIEYKIYEHN